jgi:hypothetical protein
MHPNSSLTDETETFHFALATGRYKDNRIPPKGFDIANAVDRLSVPVWHGVEAPGYFTPAEYAGGYDEILLTIPTGADYVEVSLYYQTTSREYIEFLRDEINGTGNLTLSGQGAGGDAPYLVQSPSEPSSTFFNQLKAWGDTIWQLWEHNKDVPGAAPFLMASGIAGTPPTACAAPLPTLLSATGGQTQVTLEWSNEPADPPVSGYKVYYDQAGKAQLRADAGYVLSYVDTALTNGVEYCYKVTAYDDTCESGYSNILCATPQNQGQTTPAAGVSSDPADNAMLTGTKSGKGNNQTFTQTTSFTAGDAVVVRTQVTDSNGDPISNATVEIAIGGPETVTLNSNPSGSDGWAESTWNTQSPNRKGQGGTTPGTYTATTTNVTASGYHWDSVTTHTTFTLQ